MRATVLVIFLAACGASSPTASPRESTVCDQASWHDPRKFVRCDVACATKPNESGPACTTEHGACAATFDYDGEQGCCALTLSVAPEPPGSTIAAVVVSAAFDECR